MMLKMEGLFGGCSTKRKRLLLSVGVSTVLALVVISWCASLYPELCHSASSSALAVASENTSPKDEIQGVLNSTITTVESNYFTLQHLIKTPGLTKRDKNALHDCLKMVDDTIDDLHKFKAVLNDYPFKKLIAQYADDLNTLLSAAMTNEETCVDGFSHDGADEKVWRAVFEGQMHVFRLCSNLMAMIKNFTDSNIAATAPAATSGRHFREEEAVQIAVEWPEWLPGGDRRLLQASKVTPNLTVAADGTGNYRTVAEAVAAAPENSRHKYIIKIKAGIYRENVEVPNKKTNLVFVGDGQTNTIITGSRNWVDGSSTLDSATVAVVGNGFLARDVTFENTAGPSKLQAVALRVGSDLSAFYRCSVLAYQDSLYVHSRRQFFTGCLIAGTVDFIFGNAAVCFQDCDIHARRPNPGQRNMITAQGRLKHNDATGIIIQKCRIEAASDLQQAKNSFETYLGRPWKKYSRTVIMQSNISDAINPAGWYPWNGSFALDTLFYGEYQNTGAGADTSKRVNWKGFKVITREREAHGFTPGIFIKGGRWLASTGFPFSLGL